MNGRTIKPAGSLGAAIAVALAVAVAVGAGEAHAQRYKRESKIQKVDVERTAKTRQLAPKDKKEKARPELTADDFIAIQGKVGNIRNQQVKEFEALIDETEPDDPEMPDLLFRLAELHAQQQRYWNFRGMEMYSKIDKASPKSRASLKKKQANYFDTSKRALLSAVKVYKRVSDNPKFRNYPRMDELLFYYAYTLQGAKYMKEARTIYHRLIKDYPDSKYIPEAYLSFADYYFVQNSLANAERFYDKVLQFPKSSVYNYALYKKGWVYYNLDQPQDALETWFKVAQRTQNNKKEATLNRAAKKDFVRAYAEVGKPKLAFKAFERVDKGYAFDMLQILGDIYLEKGMAEKAIYTFREMIGLRRKHKNVCDWQYNVVHAMLSVGSDDQKVKAIEDLVKLYTAYKDKNILPAENLSECRDNAEGVTSEMAKIWHNEALKTLNIETLAYVDRLYQMFLSSFPESPEHGDMQFYYAELMWSRAENEKNQRLATELWEQAAVAFTDVVKSGKLKGKKLKESAFAAVLAWKNALDVDPRTKAPPLPSETQPDKVPEAQPIPEREQKMIAAFDIYIDYIKDPKDEELVMMKFLKAKIFWRYNHFDQAVGPFEDIVNNHISHETSEAAINLLLDTLNNAQRYDDLVSWVDRLLEKKKYLEDHEELAQRLEVIKRQSLRKAAEKLEKDAETSGDFDKYVACGTAYIEIFNRNPDGANSDEVLYNAGVCFEKGKSIGTAISMFQLLSSNYPKSPHTQKAIARLGRNFAAIAWYREAAEKFEEYAKKFAGEKDAFEVLGEAVFYRKGIGDDKEAIADTEMFIKKFGKKRAAEAAEAMFSMTAIYEKQRDNDKVIRHLRRYLKEYGRRGGIDRQIIAHAKIGEILWQESCPVKGVQGACVKIKRERATVRRGKKRRRAALPTQCGPESKIKLTVVERDGRKLREAKSEFKRAIALFGKGAAVKKVPGDGRDQEIRRSLMVKHYAAAKFHLAEEQYESFLDLAFPTKLDFDPRNKRKAAQSKKLFEKWLQGKSKQGAKATGLYDEVRGITGGGAHWAIAAAARMGQIAQNFSDALFTADIPKDVRSGRFAEDKVDAYCDELTTQAEPLEKRSVDAYGFCLKVSTDLNWFNSWSQLCERELGQIRPQEYPTAVELRAAPNNVAPITTVAAPVLKLE